MYLARELTEHSLPEIGRGIGGRNHTTVLHAVNRIGAPCHRPGCAQRGRQPAPPARPPRMTADVNATIHSPPSLSLKRNSAPIDVSTGTNKFKVR